MSASPLTATAMACVAAPPDLTDLVGLKLGNYRLERLLGRGRMGVVYLATDEALLRPTAIKILSWSLADAGGHDPVQWFLAEARSVARINHPRVVQIYGAARHGSTCYLAMEYVAGESAEARIAASGPLAPALATDMLLQAASALHAAHRSGVIHRDVKPANLLVGPGGATKLGDFGMALGPAGVRTHSANLRVGTPYYTAPELWRGEPATAASDLYSLGATYFHLLTGRPPFDCDDLAAVERAHLLAPAPDLRALAPGLPPSCATLVQRALAKLPHERHASAEVLLWEARRILQELAAPPAVARRAERRASRRSEPSAGLAAATGPLADVLGFVRQPFSEVDPAEHPALAEPLAAAWGELLDRLEDGATSVVALTGGAGSGAAALCRRVAAELAGSRLVLHASAAGPAGDRTVVQRLCTAAGVEVLSGDDSLAALVERLGAGEERLCGAPALVVLDVGSLPRSSTAELAALARAGAWTRTFQLLLRAPAGLAADLAAAAGLPPDAAREVPVAPLDPRQVARHVHAWLGAALDPHAAPILFTPDALRLLALRSEGALERVNRIAENMLWLAAAEGRRTLSSWHAWAAPDRERWAEASPLVRVPRRPAAWPPREVVDVIDACRRAVGIPPWPRTVAPLKGFGVSA